MKKWITWVETRYFAGTFPFDTFAAAVRYLQLQFDNELEHERTEDFTATITGPGGELGWPTIAPIVGR